jgi:hypothetical protein|tara:strand:- start:80 stop:238 length:159 start_codon:yes stop_codon:yes gene_type:complete
MKIDKQKLQKQIKEGRSSHDVAMCYGVAPSTIRKKAKELGLKFEGKSYWRKG